MKSVSIANDRKSDLSRTVALILAVLTVISVMTLAVMPASDAADTSGTTGDATWTLTQNEDADTYTLTISGKGKMADYHYTDPDYEDELPPWQGHSSKITKIVLSDGLTRIGSYAFYGTAITGIEIPDTVRHIGASAFWFTSLESVTIPSSVLDIERNAFGTCRALTEITFGDSAKVKSIGASAFEGTAIESLDLSGLSSLTEIGAGAFQRNASLESVSIPAKVETVGFEAFNSCSSLSTITVPEGSMLVSLGEKAFNDTALVSVDLSNATRLSSIGESAFGSCESLTSVTLAENFGGEATGAFTGSTSLTSVTVGSSSVTIDDNGGFTIPVASIGDVGYSSLLEAVNAATDGQTITITKGDVYEAGKVVVEGKSITIDLNGKTFTSIEGITVSKEATLTIKDSGGNGNLIGESNPLIQVNGTFNLESGLLTGENSVTVRISGTFNMSGGEVNGDTAKGTYAIYFGSGTASITEGRVIGTSGDSALYCSSSNLTIGTSGSTEGPYISAIRPSGTFTFHSGEIGEVRADNITSVGVMDGVFGTDITNRLPAGYYCTLGSDGKYHVTQLTEEDAAAKIGDTLYATLNGAGSAVKDGETITVLRDYEGEDTFMVKAYNATVDLNGFTITVTAEGAYGVSVNPEYGTKYDDSKPNQVLVKNGTIVADIPLYAASGGSMYVNIVTEDLALTSASDCPDLVLGQEAHMTYTGGDIEVAGYLAESSDGTQYVYGTVAAAMDVDADKSVKLLYDSTETIVMNEAGNWTVDLNEYTVDANGDGIEVQVQGAHLTVSNGYVNASGIGAIIWDVNNPNVDIDASLTLENVNLTAQGGFGAYAHGNNKGSDITVMGGSISAPNGTGIYFPSTGKVSVDGGSISGLTGIEMRAGTLEIGGDANVESIAEGYSVGNTPEEGGSTITGAAIAIAPYSNSTTGGTMSVSIGSGTFEGPVAFSQAHISDVPDVPQFDFSISGGKFTSTGTDPATQHAYPAIVTEKGEVTEKFVTGGSFSSDVTDFMPDGMQTETDPDTGEVTVRPPVYFDREDIVVLTTTYVLEPILAQGATVTGYASSDSAFSVSEDGTVTITPVTEKMDTTITVTVTYGGEEYTASVALTHYTGITVTTEETGVTLVASGIDESDLSETHVSLLGGIEYPDDYSATGAQRLYMDVSRLDGQTDGLTFRYNVDTSALSGLEIFVVHFGESSLDYPEFTVYDGYIEIEAKSFSPFLIIAYTPEGGSEPEPEPEPDTYTITFRSEGSDDVVREYKAGTTVHESDFPTFEREGYQLSGWKYENGEPCGSEVKVDGDIVLIAQWVKQYGLSYSIDGQLHEGGSVDVTLTAGYPAGEGITFGFTYNGVDSDMEITESNVATFTITTPGTYGFGFVAMDSAGNYVAMGMIEGVVISYASEPEPGPDTPVIIPDDDDYVPLPPTVIVQDDGDGDMTGVAACAAAAVAAAIIAAFLIMEYRKD